MFILMAFSGVLAIGFPLTIGAIVGGLAIHRLGWIPLLLVTTGLTVIGFAQLDGYGFLAVYCIIAMIVGVVGIFLLAIFGSKVDIWLGLPIVNSPRLYVRKDDQKKE
jgi:hypothetical protein